MPQSPAVTRKNSSDATSSPFNTPNNLDRNRLDLRNVGADSPELLLNRARYQTVRENELAQQAEEQADVRIPPTPQQNQTSIANQPEEMAVDVFETGSDDTPQQENRFQPGDTVRGESKDNKGKEKAPDKKEETEGKDKDEKKGDEGSVKKDDKNTDKEGEKNNPPNSQGGGAEKKDPGITPQPLTKNENTAPKKEDATNNENTSPADRLNQAKLQAATNLKNAQNKLKSGDLSGAVEGVTAASKIVSAWALTTMWGAVWLDWTLLTLLGLNVYFIVSNFTDKIASFGEDYLFGKWMPKELAKWFEIILLALLDMIILSIIFMILYGGYKFYTASFWDTFFGATQGIISGEGAGAGAAKKILAP